ncbi:MAG TPA: efflux RND transporter permease subunit, partial [Acetobacteraceae bacterium]|nr:efflux RND transporter permease subunit [Acetobacteraceae bacterium]
AELDKMPEAIGLVLVPPPIQGIGNANGFTMEVEMRDGSFDYEKLQTLARTIVSNGNSQSGLQRLNTTFRASVPQLEVIVDRVKAETLNVSVGDVFSVLSGYIGSSYVNQFNKFGRTYQVYVQADSKYRLEQRDIEHLWVRSKNNQMVPLGTLVQIKHDVGPSLVSLYNLYPTATINGGAAQGFSSGQALSLMEQLADRTLPPGTGYEWTAMSYQEKVTGNQIIYAFGFGILLVYLCLAGQYESWIAPFSVILAVPLSLLGPFIALGTLGVANNLYTQIGLVLLIALSAKNAILIVEVARERRGDGEPILQAAVDAARTRFRPILMTSFAFILGVLPLVTATGAGANSRISLGLSVFSGMIASTCLAVLFVPSFFVVLQRFEERRKTRKQVKPAATAA